LSAGAKVRQHIRDAGPLEFIEYFANTDFVITDSFHGVCFALNFSKPFVVISPGKYSNRIENLLRIVGLENRMVRTESDFDSVDLSIDYKEVNRKLSSARSQSISFIDSFFRKK
jgi:polysaccharide pyruvyl transferase WcaK-like protein